MRGIQSIFIILGQSWAVGTINIANHERNSRTATLRSIKISDLLNAFESDVTSDVFKIRHKASRV